jgi:hypothetical protein
MMARWAFLLLAGYFKLVGVPLCPPTTQSLRKISVFFDDIECCAFLNVQNDDRIVRQKYDRFIESPENPQFIIIITQTLG